MIVGESNCNEISESPASAFISGSYAFALNLSLERPFTSIGIELYCKNPITSGHIPVVATLSIIMASHSSMNDPTLEYSLQEYFQQEHLISNQ